MTLRENIVRKLPAAVALAALAAAVALGPALRAQPPSSGPASSGPAETWPLEPGSTVEREVSADVAHAYSLEMAAGQKLLVTVEKRGIDLVAEGEGPGGEPLGAADPPNFGWGRLAYLLEADEAGRFRVLLRSKPGQPSTGGYALAVRELSGGGEEAPWRRIAADLTAAGRAGAASTAEARREALDHYRGAAEGLRRLAEPAWLADTLYAIANLARDLGEIGPALDAYGEALEAWRDLGDTPRQAAVLNSLGLAHWRRGELEPARSRLAEARQLWGELGRSLEEAVSLNNLGLVSHSNGALEEAREAYEQALPLFRRAGHSSLEAVVLNNLGGVFELAGEPDLALSHYTQSLAIRRRLEDRVAEAQALNNAAEIHRGVGEVQEALEAYRQALEVLEPQGNTRLEAAILSNLGYAYHGLGEHQRALAFHQRSLALRRQVEDREGEMITLNNLGLAHRELGDGAAAVGFHRQALELALAAGNRRQEASSLMLLAQAERSLADLTSARGHLLATLALRAEVQDRQITARALHTLGEVLTEAGEPAAALAPLGEALALRRAMRETAGEAQTLYQLAAAEHRLGRKASAQAHLEASLAHIEALRAELVSPRLRAAFFATQRRAYGLSIELLMDRHRAEPGAGHDLAALEISERARARSLLDLLNEGAVAPGSTAEETLVEERRALQRRLNAKAGRLLALEASDPRVSRLEGEVQSLLAKLDGVEEAMRFGSPRFAAVTRPRPLDAAGIRGLLDPETSLLEYALGEGRSFLWLVSAGGVETFELPPRAVLEDLARRAHAAFSSPRPRREAGGQAALDALSEALLAPVWERLGTARLGTERLVVVPDGALYYVPFGALPVPAAKPEAGEPREASWSTAARRVPLLAHHEVVHLPSASALAVQRRQLADRAPPPRWAAVLADPVFEAADPRNAASGTPAAAVADRRAGDGSRGAGALGLDSFHRLPGTRREAEAIAALAPEDQVWLALGFEASRETALARNLKDFRIVHFATHGLVDARQPELSGLVLSRFDARGRPRQGVLRLGDVWDLDLAADLVVLSGCQTALGEEIRGEGLVGLTRGFMYAGVPRVVASLWRVEDRATAELMVAFYRGMWQQGLSPAAALRQAQLGLWRQRRFRDPHFWAAFTIQGDWR